MLHFSPSLRCCCLIVARSLVAEESVICPLITKDTVHDLMFVQRALNIIDLFSWDAGVFHTKEEVDRAPSDICCASEGRRTAARSHGGNPRAIERSCSVNVRQGSGEIGNMTPKTKTDTANYVGFHWRVADQVIDGCLNVAQEFLCRGLLLILLANFNVVGGVTRFKTGGLALIECGCDRDIPFLSYPSSDLSDMIVHSKNFLQHHNAWVSPRVGWHCQVSFNL